MKKRLEQKKRRRNIAAENENSFSEALGEVSDQRKNLTSVLAEVQKPQGEQLKLIDQFISSMTELKNRGRRVFL